MAPPPPYMGRDISTESMNVIVFTEGYYRDRSRIGISSASTTSAPVASEAAKRKLLIVILMFNCILTVANYCDGKRRSDHRLVGDFRASASSLSKV